MYCYQNVFFSRYLKFLRLKKMVLNLACLVQCPFFVINGCIFNLSFIDEYVLKMLIWKAIFFCYKQKEDRRSVWQVYCFCVKLAEVI